MVVGVYTRPAESVRLLPAQGWLQCDLADQNLAGLARQRDQIPTARATAPAITLQRRTSAAGRGLPMRVWIAAKHDGRGQHRRAKVLGMVRQWRQCVAAVCRTWRSVRRRRRRVSIFAAARTALAATTTLTTATFAATALNTTLAISAITTAIAATLPTAAFATTLATTTFPTTRATTRAAAIAADKPTSTEHTAATRTPAVAATTAATLRHIALLHPTSKAA